MFYAWLFPAFAASLLAAGFGLVNQYFKVPGKLLVLWRGIIPVLIMAPLLPFFPAPTDPLFYGFVLCNGFVAYFADHMFFTASARYGAGLPLRLNPLAVFLTFLTWLALDPSQATLLADHPLIALGLIGAFITCLASLSLMAKCKVTAEGIRYYLPRLLLGVMIDTLNKKAMMHADITSGPIYYTTIMSAMIFIMALPSAAHDLRTQGLKNFIKVLWKPGVMIGTICLGLMVSKNIAMKFTPNPAYVSSVIMLSPLWVSLLMAARGEKELGRKTHWLILLASAFAMLFLIQKLQQG